MTPEIIIFFATKLHILILTIAVGSFFFLHAKKRKHVLLLALFALPTAFLLGKLANVLVVNPRPFVVDNITPLIQHAADNGFPSDHTLLAATVASIVCAYHKPTGFFLLGLSALVGIARVFAGVHHYLDVAGSLSIAIVATYAATKVIQRL